MIKIQLKSALCALSVVIIGLYGQHAFLHKFVRHCWLDVILIAGLAIAMPVQAESTNANEQKSESSAAGSGWHHGAPFAYTDGLLGPLGGKRAELSENGVDVHLSTLVIGQSIVKGGIDKRDKLSSSYDFQVYLDSAKLGLWRGGYGLVRAEGKAGLDGINTSRSGRNILSLYLSALAILMLMMAIGAPTVPASEKDAPAEAIKMEADK